MSKTELVPEEKAGFFSAYSLKWLDYYFDLGSDITTEHIPKTIEQRDVEFIYEKLNSNWNAELSHKESPSIIKAVVQTEKAQLFYCLFLSLFAALVQFAAASTLGLLIDWFGKPDILGIYNNEYDALILLAIVMTALYLSAYFYFLFMYKVMMLGYNIRAKCAAILFRKLIRLNSKGDQEVTAGNSSIHVKLFGTCTVVYYTVGSQLIALQLIALFLLCDKLRCAISWDVVLVCDKLDCAISWDLRSV